MHFNTFKKSICLMMAVLMLTMSGCVADPYIDLVKSFLWGTQETPVPSAKPQVTVAYGSADPVTVDLQEGVPTSEFSTGDFSKDSKGRFTYTSADGTRSMLGIDVSEHQQYPDWNKIAADGIEFAMIRLGYRGSSEGMLYKDPIFRYNLVKAHNAGLKVGIYFFSQATCRAEAEAEAYYVLSVLEEFKDKIDLPVVFDWEETAGENSRTAGLDGKTVSDCAMYFTDIIREGGYTPGVYFNRHMGYYLYNLAQLPDVEFWFAGEGDYSDFYYAHDMWQYTFTGKVNGINGDVDMNLMFVPQSQITPNDTAEADTTEGETTETAE